MEDLDRFAMSLWQPSHGGCGISIRIPKTQGARFGLSGWGQRVVFAEVELSAAHHPFVEPAHLPFSAEQLAARLELREVRPTSRDVHADALTSLALVLLNTNEFLYVE